MYMVYIYIGKIHNINKSKIIKLINKAYNPSTWQLEVGESGVQFKVILSYIRIKKEKKYNKEKHEIRFGGCWVRPTRLEVPGHRECLIP